MEVLHDEREASLAEIAFARLAHGAGWWIGPERFVICASVVVTGEAEEAGYPEDEECGRVRQEARKPVRLGAEERVRRTAEEFRRIERRNIWAEGVVLVLKCCPG